jgi:hypothetical protein
MPEQAHPPPSPIDLDPADWLVATWRPRAPLPRGPEPPFDRAEALARLGRLSGTGEACWDRAGLHPAMSRAEARFWYEAITQAGPSSPPAGLALRLAKAPDDHPLGRPEILSRLRRNGEHLVPHVVLPLARLLPPGDVLAIALSSDLDAPARTAPGLATVTTGRGKLAEAAQQVLRDLARAGHAPVVETVLAETRAAGRVLRAVAGPPAGTTPFDAESTPPWLRAAAAEQLGGRPARLPRWLTPEHLPPWLTPEHLPPLCVGGRHLDGVQLHAALNALRESTLARPAPLATLVKEHAQAASRDAFAWALCEPWLAAGGPSADRWALTAVGLWGGDGAAVQLAALVRAWPAARQTKRAQAGLECLRAIGTETALLELSGIAQKVRFRSVQQTAAGFMIAIAQERRLSTAQLEDRIVPHLDARGSRVLDFGPRAFRVVLDEHLKPRLCDGAGKARADLPRPAAGDDPAKAADAVAAWKALKKQLREVLKVQRTRLESAMVAQRRWSAGEFEAYLVRHPLMGLLARGVVWGGLDPAGRLARTFRVTEDRTLALRDESPCSLEGLAGVFIVHPLHLADEDRRAWLGVLADHEVLPPFEQLTRKVSRLEPHERSQKVLHRVEGKRVAAAVLLGVLDRTGWDRGPARRPRAGAGDAPRALLPPRRPAGRAPLPRRRAAAGGLRPGLAGADAGGLFLRATAAGTRRRLPPRARRAAGRGRSGRAVGGAQRARGAGQPVGPALVGPADVGPASRAGPADSSGCGVRLGSSDLQWALRMDIDLDPADWFLAGWRGLPPLSLPEPRPFDRDDCLKRLAAVKRLRNGWDWRPADIAVSLTPEEGRFWVWAMARAGEEPGAKTLAGQMRQQPTDALPPVETLVASLGGRTSGLGAELARAGYAACGTEGFVRLYLNLWPNDPQRRKLGRTLREDQAQLVCAGFLHDVRPYLSREQLAVGQALVRPVFAEEFARTRQWVHYPLALLARSLDLHAEVEMLVSSWPDDSYGRGVSAGGADLGSLVFGLGDPAGVRRHVARLGMRLGHAGHVRAFLAHTGADALSVVRDHILACGNGDAAEEMARVLAAVKTPAVAPLMLELTRAGKGAAAARRWLDENLSLAAEGLLPLAGGRDELAEAALHCLRDAVRSGRADVVGAALARQADAVGERVREVLLSAAGAEALDESSLPAWFVQNGPDKPVPLPPWLDPATLPPVTVGGRGLKPGQTAVVVGALKGGTLAEPAPLVRALKEHADGLSLEAFAWDLFERWLGAGAPPKDKWAMTALGTLGGDAVCLKLGPLVRDWPGQAQHKRSAHGLECLRAVGSEQALLQLHHLAGKVKSPALKRQAREFVEQIAAERGLTAAQLEDRIVPDLGLDARGSRVFDYGPRQFLAALGPDLNPCVRDEAGNVRTDLPRPAAKDDGAKAASALGAWKQFKQQCKEVLKTQGERLEKAMTRRRRWRPAEFERHLVRHPLMRSLARVVLWAAFDPEGRIQAAFRVTEDGECADAGGEPVGLAEGWEVGVVHPALLSEEERARWARVWADHDLLPPFAQLGRRVFKLTADEAAATMLRRFEGTTVPGRALLGAAKKTGWEPSSPDGNYKVTRHWKHYPEAALTASLTYGPGLEPHYGLSTAVEDQVLGCVYFVPGGEAGAEKKPAGEAVPLGTVDVLVLNEAASLLFALSGKKG